MTVWMNGFHWLTKEQRDLCDFAIFAAGGSGRDIGDELDDLGASATDKAAVLQALEKELGDEA